MMYKTLPAIAAVLLFGTLAHAQENNPAPVSKAEYDKLKADLKAEFDAQLKAQRAQFKKELAEAKAQLGRKIEEQAAGQLIPVSAKGPGGKDCFGPILATPVVVSEGTSKLTLTGGASATYVNSGWSNDFSALFNPIFLWEINDRLRVEGDVVFGTGQSILPYGFQDTSTQVQTAEISYDLCDYLTLGAGRFANPTDYFAMNLRKDWVNKLPNSPQRTFLPEFEDGVELSGEFPLGSTLLSYAAFVGSSPTSKNFGSMNYSFYPPGSDFKRTLEVGGRLAFQPIPGLEIGYGVETFKEKGEIDNVESYWALEWVDYGWGRYQEWQYHQRHNRYAVRVRPVLHTLDLNYFKDLNCLKGTLDFHTQWTWSNVDRSDLPPQYDSLGTPFEANHNGGYAQLAYRPTHLNCFLANFEPVVRFDYNESQYGHNEEWTFGLDYWLAERTVIKAAYEYMAYPWSDSNNGLWLLQFATGF